jgi:hypothetical protein
LKRSFRTVKSDARLWLELSREYPADAEDDAEQPTDADAADPGHTGAPCYGCKTLPAGNDYGGPNSAYCPECQPRDTRPQPRGSQCGCAACGRIFATLTDFDRHQRWGGGGEQDYSAPLRCLDPASLGLELAGGVWGTPEGNARRRQDAARMAARRRAGVL